LQLPKLLVSCVKQTIIEPLVDYTKSVIMIGNAYIKAMEEKEACKELLEKEKELKKLDVVLTKRKRTEDKIKREVEKLQHLANVRA
jgi:hypothetical protein